MHGSEKGHWMREQYLPRENRKEKNRTVRRKPLVSGLRMHPVKRLSTDHWSVTSKQCKHMQLQVLLTQTEVLGVRFLVWGNGSELQALKFQKLRTNSIWTLKKKKKIRKIRKGNPAILQSELEPLSLGNLINRVINRYSPLGSCSKLRQRLYSNNYVNYTFLDHSCSQFNQAFFCNKNKKLDI